MGRDTKCRLAGLFVSMVFFAVSQQMFHMGTLGSFPQRKPAAIVVPPSLLMLNSGGNCSCVWHALGSLPYPEDQDIKPPL